MRVKRSTILVRQMEMLFYLQQQCEANKTSCASLSLKAMSQAHNLSVNQIRRVLKELERATLIRMERQTLPSGGSSENLYHITPRGRVFLDAFREFKLND